MVETADTRPDAPMRRPAARSRYFLGLAVATTAVAVLGFVPTYWMQVPAGTFAGAPLIHFHAALSTAWMLLLVAQAWLVSAGRLRRHREWGLAGIALATLVVVVGTITAIASLKERLARGEGDVARAFLSTPLVAMALFAIFTALAIGLANRPEWHKRFMIAGTVSLVDAAAARFPFLAAQGLHPGLRPGFVAPPTEAMPVTVALLLQLVVVAGMIHDRRTRGRVHPAWTVSLLASVPVLLLKVPLSHTAAWLAFADWTTRIAG